MPNRDRPTGTIHNSRIKSAHVHMKTHPIHASAASVLLDAEKIVPAAWVCPSYLCVCFFSYFSRFSDLCPGLMQALDLILNLTSGSPDGYACVKASRLSKAPCGNAMHSEMQMYIP